ncbi:MAG TPA: aldo/keto reductase [Sulfolobales archaeon]|nr:aldo/keto reductase [Sulfolobales archaeon]
MRFHIDPNDRKPLGRTGETVPAIGIGTWRINNYSMAETALIRAIEVGMNLIDTAEMYANGEAERLVGRVCRITGRDRVFIVTKILPDRFSDQSKVIKALEASLRRLGTSYVDLVLIHWPRPGISIERQIQFLEATAEAGMARFIGVSNFGLENLSRAIKATKKHEIVANQVKYSVLDKQVEKDLLGFSIENKILIQAYTPLEWGGVAKNETVVSIAKKHGKTPIQVALNYLISRPMVMAIPKTERVERVEEFRGSMGWRLSAEDIEVLEKI